MTKGIVKCGAYAAYTAALVIVIPVVLVAAMWTVIRDDMNDGCFEWRIVGEMLECTWSGVAEGIKEGYEEINRKLGD